MPLYSLRGHGEMLHDRARVDAYARALGRAVRPGHVVLDIGTGAGVMAVLACRFGASHVFAIEPEPIIEIAREVAIANGCADRITFIEGRSTDVTLPAGADVIVSDLRGVLPLFQHHLASIIDARRRLLAPGGRLIPLRDRLVAAVVEVPDAWRALVASWDNNGLGLDLDPARRLVTNDFSQLRPAREQVITDCKPWVTIDYETIEETGASGGLDFIASRRGIGHGFVVWFDADLDDEVRFSNAPGLPATVYGNLFFPWREPISLKPGQRVHVDLDARLVDDDYFWAWSTQSGETSFRQSQLDGAMLSPSQLRRSASDFTPELSELGEIRRRSLQLMDGTRSLEDVARVIAAEFPERCRDWRQALTIVAAMSRENSR